MVSLPVVVDPVPITQQVTYDPPPQTVSLDLDLTDFATVMRLAGWPETEIDTGCAVAMAEAGKDKIATAPTVWADAVGDLTLVSPVYGVSMGPFQIRRIRDPLAQFQNFDRWRCGPALFVPFYNCWAALQIKNALGWGAWSTYGTTDTAPYKQYLGWRPKLVTGHPSASQWWK